MPASLQGKTVLITGASAGIGRAAVKAFAEAGAVVIAAARSKDRLETLSAELGGAPRVDPIVADVADGASMESLSRTVLERHGPPDVVVANAGRGLDAKFELTTDHALREIFEVNVFGVFRTIRPFLPGMTARGSGRILIVSSVVGKRGVPHYAAYSASKFALHGMADALRPELVGTGVTVGVICPSSTETEFRASLLREGPPQRSVRARRHSAESVAAALVSMSQSTRRELVLSVEGKFMGWMNHWAPGLFDRILARALVKND